MEFEFAKYTEITDFVFEVRPEFKNDGYVRFFICPDVNDFWFARILEGVNEEYEKEEGSFLLERNNIRMIRKGEPITTDRLKKIIEDDDGSNWDIHQSYDMNELIEMLDDGFGILNLKEAL